MAVRPLGPTYLPLTANGELQTNPHQFSCFRSVCICSARSTSPQHEVWDTLLKEQRQSHVGPGRNRALALAVRAPLLEGTKPWPEGFKSRPVFVVNVLFMFALLPWETAGL